MRKVQDPDFHSGSWGGDRSSKYPHEQDRIWEIVWSFIKNVPQAKLEDIQEFLKGQRYYLSRMSISRLLKKWRWSFKIPCVRQVHKYTYSNIDYYMQFCIWLSCVDLRKVKTVDEVHFDRKGTDFILNLFLKTVINNWQIRISGS